MLQQNEMHVPSPAFPPSDFNNTDHLTPQAPLATQHRPEKQAFDDTDDALDLPTSLKKLHQGGSDSQAQSLTNARPSSPLPTPSPPPSSPTSESHTLDMVTKRSTRPIKGDAGGQSLPPTACPPCPTHTVGKHGVGLRWRTDEEVA